MIRLDTNVVVYASDPDSKYHRWAGKTIANAVSGDGAAISAASLAELCVSDPDPQTVADRLRSWGILLVDVPAVAAIECANAYRLFRERHARESGKTIANMPFPDFFVGAHAKIMSWELATADRGRFSTYFPDVTLNMPQWRRSPVPGRVNAEPRTRAVQKEALLIKGKVLQWEFWG